MVEQLIEKRNSLLDEHKQLQTKRELEKRSTYSSEEFERVNAIKIELDNLDKQIEVENDLTQKRNKKLDLLTVSTPSIVKSVDENEFRSFLTSLRGGKCLIPMEEVEKRATVTTSTNSHLKFTDMADGLSVNEQELVLESLGAQMSYFESGNVDYPSLAAIVGAFGTEDNSVSDQSVTTAKKTLTPTFVTASIEVSKTFIAQSKKKNIDDLKNALIYGVKKAIEKRTIDTMASLTAVASGTTGFTGSLYGAVLNLEAAINGSGTGYIFSRSGVEKAKKAKIDAGSGQLVYKDGIVNGYKAVRSSLMTNTNHLYYGDFRSVVMAMWGSGVEIEMVTDGTMAKKGNVLIIASCLADGSYTDANKIAVCKNVDKLF